MVLPDSQFQLLMEFAKQSPVLKKPQVVNFRVDQVSTPVFAAILPHAHQPSISVVVGLPARSPHCFVSVVDTANASAVASAIAVLEGIDASDAANEGSCVPLELPLLLEKGVVAAQVLEIAQVGPLVGFPRFLQVADRRLHCLWVVWLSSDEYEVRASQGLKELLYRFDSGRDLVGLGGSSR